MERYNGMTKQYKIEVGFEVTDMELTQEMLDNMKEGIESYIAEALEGVKIDEEDAGNDSADYEVYNPTIETVS